MMPMEQIENLKQNYTDKYVVVDGRRPELARFRDQVGQVKTVNMNGRALVQFADYHLNTGWYDIDLGYLKVVDKPAEAAKQPAEKKHAAPAKKPVSAAPAAAGEKKLSPLEMARLQGAPKGAAVEAKPAPAKAAPAAGKPSVADILAAARGGAAAAPAAPKQAAPTVKAEPKKMSTADILSSARGKEITTPSAPAAKVPAEKPVPVPATVPEVQKTTPESAAPVAKPEAGIFDKSSMSIEQMIAWCRERDDN